MVYASWMVHAGSAPNPNPTAHSCPLCRTWTVIQPHFKCFPLHFLLFCSISYDIVWLCLRLRILLSLLLIPSHQFTVAEWNTSSFLRLLDTPCKFSRCLTVEKQSFILRNSSFLSLFHLSVLVWHKYNFRLRMFIANI